MTIIRMSKKGQIVVPKNIRDEHGFGNGSVFSVLETKSGTIVLKPVKASPKTELVDHLLGLKGLDIPERKHLCPQRRGFGGNIAIIAIKS